MSVFAPVFGTTLSVREESAAPSSLRRLMMKSIVAAAVSLIFMCACTSVQAGMYLVSIDNKNGETILQQEYQVKELLEDMVSLYENYSIKVFVRTGVNFQYKRTKLLSHSYYLLVDNKTGVYHTLSFYGTKMSFYSEGAWALDANSDMSSYNMYLTGDNRWDVEEMFAENVVDVRKTLINIINKIDSDITYYYKDHIKNKPKVDNCNTALQETLCFKEK
ncbi:MAG: hypothetical protein Pg6A_05600 [Termitinemataceae bacterium]|nr:MAG: hypothetical protein Pg6A_05600 [Termitinemataceae bacterium]